MRHPVHRPLRAVASAALMAATLPTQAATLALHEVINLSLRELLEVKVTTVARREQSLMDSPAAVTVITAEEIRRSGANDIPDLLRGVPGLHVARLDGNSWAISARGFNSIWANRLHVLVDGRSIYNPLFGGVNWDTLNLPLDNIERIEVARGPGGTLWGANSVNGVINIITRSAADTQGTLAQWTQRSPEGSELTLRRGGRLDGGGHWRLHARHFDGDGFIDYPGRDAKRGERDTHLGARLDRPLNGRDTLRLEAEFQNGTHDQHQHQTAPDRLGSFVVDDRDEFTLYHLLANWSRDLGDGEQWSLQTYLQHDARDTGIADARIDTFDVDFQHHLRPHPDHRLSWGLGYRRVDDWAEGGYLLDILPHDAESDLYSAFLQDEIALGETLRLTLGSKFEHNDQTGFEYQPSLRLAWSPGPDTTVWGALTRAVRTPSRTHSQLVAHPFVVPRFPPFRLVPVTVLGDPDPDADVTVSWEAGARRNFPGGLTIDLAAYYNEHRNLYTLFPDPADPLLLVGDTAEGGHDYGLELSGGRRISERWRINLSYAYHEAHIAAPASGLARTRHFNNGPRHLFSLHSYLEPAPRWELDAALYYTDELPQDISLTPTAATPIDAWWRADLRLGWHPDKHTELSLAAQNLLDSDHREYDSAQAIAGHVPRSLLARVTWRF